MSKKRILILLPVIIILAIIGWQIFKPKALTYKTTKILRGAITQEISETGAIKKGDPINLNFKSSGTISTVNVIVGQNVAAGQVLAQLNADQLKIQLAHAQAQLAAADVGLEKLLNGASNEEIKIYQTAAENAQVALANAQNAQAIAVQTAADAIKDAYTKADDAVRNYTDRLFTDPTTENASFGAVIVSGDTRYSIEAESPTRVMIDAERKNIESLLKDLSFAAKYPLRPSLEITTNETRRNLLIIQKFLNDVAAVVNSYNSANLTYDTVYQSYRAAVLAARTSVDAAITSINAAIAALKTANTAADAAQGGVNAARDQLAKVTMAPRQEDIDAAKAQIRQAQAQVSLLDLQISDSQLIAPASGQIINMNAKSGETIQPLTAAPAIVMLAQSPWVIEVNIYEEDVPKEKVGDSVIISMPSIPDKNFSGKVISIDPSGVLVNGVVYYLNKISFDKAPEGLKPEMSADVVIITAVKNDALIVPESALQKKDNNYFVQVLEGKTPKDKPVQTGIKSKGQVEIISGLTVGEEIIIP